jgi:beta-exotoxin I transport system permease protein
MNVVILRRTWHAQRVKLLVIVVALTGWGFLMPVVYASYGAQFREILNSGLIPRQLAEFGGGDIFSLPGAIALGFIHPLAVALNSVFAVGFAAAGVAGERQRGTLEVLLARPVSRRGLTLTMFVALLVFVALTVVAFVVGATAASALWGVIGEIEPSRLPLLWLNGALLFAAFGSIGLAASVSFDRLTPALGIGLAVAIVSYFLDVLGSLWPDAKGLQPLSLFHYVRARDVLAGNIDPVDFAVLAGVAILGLVVALVVFPRRDLAAPS